MNFPMNHVISPQKYVQFANLCSFNDESQIKHTHTHKHGKKKSIFRHNFLT